MRGALLTSEVIQMIKCSMLLSRRPPRLLRGADRKTPRRRPSGWELITVTDKSGLTRYQSIRYAPDRIWR
jgi:hypothetical protein